MKVKDISGIDIRAFPISEATLKCTFTMSYSDAKELFKKTCCGIPSNRVLREWFIDKLEERVGDVIEQKGK